MPQLYRGKRPIWKGMRPLYEGLLTVRSWPRWRKDGGHDQLASVTVLTATHELQCYHGAMRRMPLPLLVLIILIALPVAIPVAIVLWIWDHRRVQAAAERTNCECCGATLGSPSLRRADAEWPKRVAVRQSARPLTRLRMIRSLWAICVCGAEYDYDFRIRIFHRVAGSDDPMIQAR